MAIINLLTILVNIVRARPFFAILPSLLHLSAQFILCVILILSKLAEAVQRFWIQNIAKCMNANEFQREVS